MNHILKKALLIFTLLFIVVVLFFTFSEFANFSIVVGSVTGYILSVVFVFLMRNKATKR